MNPLRLKYFMAMLRELEHMALSKDLKVAHAAQVVMKEALFGFRFCDIWCFRKQTEADTHHGVER